MAKNNQQKSLFWMIVRLTLVFIFAQVALIYFQNDMLLNQSPVRDFMKTQAFNSSTVIWGWVGLIAAQLLLYAAFVFVVWWLTRATAFFLKLSWNTTRLLGLIILFFALLFVFFANQYYFPNSIFAFLPHTLNAKIANFITGNLIHTMLFILGAMFIVTSIMAFIGTAIWVAKNPAVIVVFLIAVIGISAYEFYIVEAKPQPVVAKKSSEPNIIIIGVDSLRPSALTYFGSEKEYMPNVDKLLKQSTVFSHSLSPLARTSPAWASILTGEYPKNTNIRFNLTNPRNFTLTETLPNLLKRNGYYTVFATDDREFNQIDEQFGFEKIIGPKMGFNDFLFSQVNDFPLSNLIMNFAFSQSLFPFNYANRAATATYLPETFSQELKKQIQQLPKDKPLFMAVHFTLPHWPFYYGELAKPSYESKEVNEALYYETLTAADQQVDALFKTLKAQGLLNNTLVIFLSDHGNSFGNDGDRVTQKQNFTPETLTPQARFYTESAAIGHGTDVLSLTQYHNVLAMKYFNGKNQFVGEKNSVVSLIDVTPTVLDFLKIKSPYAMQGVSLLPLVNSQQELTLPRSIFIESGFTIPAVLSGTPKAEEILKQGIAYYQVVPETGYMVINPVYAPMIVKGKNRAIISSPWMLAFYPNQDQPGTLVLVNLVTKQWTTDMQSGFAQSSPLRALATQLKRFYGEEIIMPNLGS